MNNNIGRKLDGRYELKELIGSGGMADIYKAYDSIEEKEVAVKILKEEYARDEDFLRRFRNESKAIALLSHPNIVKIYDVGFTEKIQFIVMEYIDGITLTEYIEKEGALKWKDAVHFTLQILRALQHAHDKGIVHRDVKPQNVMLLQDGTIKVMDFGIARFARETGKTLSDKAIGSVHYISPEQARGEHTDERSDIYSTGVMLYEMLTGKKPYDGETPVAIALMHMQSDFILPTEINPDIPKGLEEIVIRAMQKDMDRRYQSASEMIKDIEEFKKDSTIVFEYKYMTNDETTKYFDKVTDTKDTGKAVKIDDEDELEKDDELSEDEEKKPSPFVPILAAVASAFVIIAAIVIVIVIVSTLNSPSKEIAMPNILGLTVAQVQEQYPDFKFEEGEPEFSVDYEEGQICKQDPVEGTTVKSSRTIAVIVSKGKEMFEIEDVVGKQYKIAKKLLEDKGYVIQTQYETNDVAADYVIKTDPEPGTSLAQGETINVYVSLGPVALNAIMPNVVGKTKAAAKSALEAEGINAVFEEVDSTVTAGSVVSQYPKAQTVIDGNTTVTVKISSGKAPKSNLSVNVSIPTGVSGDYQFSAYIDGEKIKDSTISVGDTSGWNVEAVGTGTATLTVKVMNAEGVNETYAVYTIDYDKGTSKLSGSVNKGVFDKKTQSTNADSEAVSENAD